MIKIYIYFEVSMGVWGKSKGGFEVFINVYLSLNLGIVNPLQLLFKACPCIDLIVE